MNKTTQKSFEILYKEVALPLMKFLVKRMGGRKDAAEEVFSQTVLAAFKGWHTFENKSSYFTWVCRIGLNKIADYYRYQIHEKSHIIAPTLETIANIADKSLTPEEKVALDELGNMVRECLNLLPPQKRQLLYLRYWKELTLKEIAQIYNLSERSVEGKIYRAKLELKQIITDKESDLALAYSNKR